MKTGDAIASVAQPIAKTLDAIWGTDLQNCIGCKRMQTDLNNAETLWDFADAIRHRFRSREENQKETNANTCK